MGKEDGYVMADGRYLSQEEGEAHIEAQKLVGDAVVLERAADVFRRRYPGERPLDIDETIAMLILASSTLRARAEHA